MRAQDLADVRHPDLERILGVRRGPPVPDSVHEPVDGDHPAGAEHEQREEPSLLRAAELQRPTMVDHFERSENPELDVRGVDHCLHLPLRSARS